MKRLKITVLGLIIILCSCESDIQGEETSITVQTIVDQSVTVDKQENNICLNKVQMGVNFHYQSMKEFNNVDIRRVTFKDSVGMMFEGIFSFDKNSQHYIDGVCHKSAWIDDKHEIIYGKVHYYNDSSRFVFGFFEFDSDRERLDMFPDFCDTTGLISDIYFYYIDSGGTIFNYDEFNSKFELECVRYR